MLYSFLNLRFDERCEWSELAGVALEDGMEVGGC
jgi:hypothetical protein